MPAASPHGNAGKDERITLPGASKSRKLAEFEKLETSSSFRGYPCESTSVEPTLIAVVIHAGDAIPTATPSFPDETMVAIPTDLRLSILAFNAGYVASH